MWKSIYEGFYNDDMKVFGIQFAPVNVPFRRRLQTLAAAAWFVTMAFGGFMGMSLAIYLIVFTKLWWMTLLYLGWAWVVDKNAAETCGRKSEWVRSWSWWQYFKDYFPLNLERVPWVELDDAKNYLFCCFPHGMLSSGAFNAFATAAGGFHEFFPRHEPHIITLTQHYSMPFFRELALALGGCSASAKSIDNILKHPGGGKVCVLMVGGAAEAYYCKPGQYKIVLKNRKGFVKLALKNGSPLVPVLSFGETDLYNQMEGSTLRRVQEFLRKYIGLAPVIPLGRGFFQYSFGIIPQRRPVTTVVGRPVEVEKIENPSTEQIEELHGRFVRALTALFEEQKHQYLKNPDTVHLEIE